MMRGAPKAMRLHIGLFGRRNVGKSSLLNAITRQQVSIVSDFAGTTTDPVEKPMELLPLGPVLFIDTAGLDDVGVLGELRTERTRAVFDRVDLGVIVCEAGQWQPFEEGILAELRERNVPVVAVFNKSDLAEPSPELVEALTERQVRVVSAAASEGRGILEFRQALLDSAPADFVEHPASGDLVGRAKWPCWWCPSTRKRPKGG